MSDLIRRDKAEEVVAWWMRIDAEGEYSPEEVKDWPFAKHARNLLSKVPSVDAEPVARGWWTEKYDECSACGKQVYEFIEGCVEGIDYLPDYCPHCGAKMDLEGAGEYKEI